MTRYLIAYDGSPSSAEAVVRVRDLYREGDSVAVVSVSQGPAGGTQLNRPQRDAASHRRQTEEAAAWLNDGGVAVERMEASGNPAPAICAAARDGAFDVIVVGSRNLDGAHRLVLGSVSAGVVHHADCDVIVVKGPRG